MQGRSLEELDYLFEQTHPVKASLETKNAVIRQDGTVKLEDDV